ncbi:TPA_asm: fusion protein [Stevia rebaudiana amalgavirus 1]|nr:TPA_asm: fusion protein [Stevia rebaudiana amalgavirus 1]
MAGQGTPEYTMQKTPAEEQTELLEAAQPLIAFHFPQGIFNRNEAVNFGLPHKSFLKHVKTVARFAENDQLTEVVQLGAKHNIFATHVVCTLKQFISLSRFLTSKEGTEAMIGVNKQAKLQKRAAGVFEASDVALENILQIQRQDYSNSIKTEMLEYDKAIDELRLEMRRLEERKETRRKEIIDAFTPVSVQPEILEEEMNSLAWDMYVNAAEAKGQRPVGRTVGGQELAIANFSGTVKRIKDVEFVKEGDNQNLLFNYAKAKLLSFVPTSTRRAKDKSRISWQQQVEERLMLLPLPRRKALCSIIPVGYPHLPNRKSGNQPLNRHVSEAVLQRREQLGVRVRPDLAVGMMRGKAGMEVMRTSRIHLHRSFGQQTPRSIPTARSKWEAGTRRIIGGGSMRSFHEDNNKFRGGGNIQDALLLLGTAIDDPPGRLLRDLFNLNFARETLSLPTGLEVPDGSECCRMRNFNDEATAGPFLRAFGIKGKHGLKEILEREMWEYYDGFGEGRLTPEQMPHFTARVGFRSKLVSKEKAMKKVIDGAPIGRAVMMMDALEQAASSPLYNVLTKLTYAKRLEATCGFKNGVVKASSDWGVVWEEVKEAKAIVELDWSKFDRERPPEDIEFIISIILSCFTPRNDRQRRLLEGYGLMMRRALIERLMVLDDGGVFGIEGMVPSGSLWTGWLDTALNILYIKAACREVFILSGEFNPMCAGDDNLTLFKSDHGDKTYRRIQGFLNSWFRAGIEDEDFLIHRPPFHVTKLQACFPPGTDLSKGTSGLMNKAEWVEFEGEVTIDESKGKSHRWEYVFKGKPKFLSNFWLVDGQPIRPTSDNLEKLLWPEGVHKTIEDYEQSIMSMVVDNPWNHHCVNHMLMRYVIVQQMKRVDIVKGALDEFLFLACIRDADGGVIPFPMIAPWRRGKVHRRMEDYPEVMSWVKDFSSFVRGVTTLYSRASEGGIDAWRFMEFIRGESNVGEGQFGNDLIDWLLFLKENPCTKYLKSVRGFRKRPPSAQPDAETSKVVQKAFMTMREDLSSSRIKSGVDFALRISDRLTESH